MPTRSHRPGERDSTDGNVQTGPRNTDEREGGFLSFIRDLFDRDTPTPATDTPVLDAVEEVVTEETVDPAVEDAVVDARVEGEGDVAVEAPVVGPAVEADEAAVQDLEQKVERRMERAEDVEKVTLTAGSEYTVTEDDLKAPDPWRHIARGHGMSPSDLQAFNQHIIEVSDGGPTRYSTTPLAVGAPIYLPSAQELGFAEVRRGTKDYDEALRVWGEMSQGPNVRILDAARSRASGELGESMGTEGVDGGRFYTANPTLAGASKKRSEVIGGQRMYKVFWLPDFWKCSLFMHDVVWQAGYVPHQSSNDHYALAGRLQESKHYAQISAAEARPGDCWQRFGGTRSDESHNAILTSMVDIEDIDDTHQRWSMDILGAEDDRAAESERSFVVDKTTGEVTEGMKRGKIVRFFRPKAER